MKTLKILFSLLFCVFFVSFVFLFINKDSILFVGPINKIDAEGLRNIKLIDVLRTEKKVNVCCTEYKKNYIKEPYLIFSSSFKRKAINLYNLLFSNPKKIIVSDQSIIFGAKEHFLLKFARLKLTSKKIALIDSNNINELGYAKQRIEKNFDLILVEDEEVKCSLIEAGVKTRINLIPRYMNLEALENLPIKIQASDVFIFNICISNDAKYSKRLTEVIDTFHSLYSAYPDVILRIHLKSTKHKIETKNLLDHIKKLKSHNIFVTEGLVSEETFHAILKYTDCFINLGKPSGMNVMKSAYLGIPILTYNNDYLSVNEYTNDGRLLLNIKKTNDLSSLKDLMRSIYTDYGSFIKNNASCRRDMENEITGMQMIEIIGEKI